MDKGIVSVSVVDEFEAERGSLNLQTCHLKPHIELWLWFFELCQIWGESSTLDFSIIKSQ
jgi:hypothetical protein